jgi:membrane fusion protein, multidrug efflux system
MDETRSETIHPRPAALPPGQAPLSDRPPRRFHLIRWLLILLVVLLIAWLGWRFFGPGSGAKHAKNASDAAQPVGVAKADTGDMKVVLTGLGTVTPMATVTVQTQINGQLMSVGYTEGQLVKQGDFLAQVDPRPYQVALAQAQGTLAHDSALLAQAKSDLARFTILGKQDSIAQQQLADQQFLVQQDEGTVQVDQAQVDNAKLNLAYTHIVSPVSGRVGLRLVDPGNYVQTSGSTGLVVVTQLQPISVVFVLPEDDIPALMDQMQAGATLGVTGYDRSNAKKLADGTLITIDNTVDTTTGAVKLRASFPNTDNRLFPNQFVNAQLLLKTLPNVVRAPVAAVQQGAPGSFVYLVKPDNSVGIQVVKTGVTDGDQIQILSGLNAGDTVVVDGADRLKDGAKITVTPNAKGSATPNNGPGAPPGQQHSGGSQGQNPNGPAQNAQPENGQQQNGQSKPNGQ